MVMHLGIPENLAILILEADQQAFTQGIDADALDPGRVPAIAPVDITAGEQIGKSGDALVLLVDGVVLNWLAKSPLAAKLIAANMTATARKNESWSDRV